MKASADWVAITDVQTVNDFVMLSADGVVVAGFPQETISTDERERLFAFVRSRIGSNQPRS